MGGMARGWEELVTGPDASASSWVTADGAI
jgi:hypothetical protein